MKKLCFTVGVFAMLYSGQFAFAGQGEFCAGFTQGFKAIKGNMVLVPLCPLAPLTPLGSTDFQEGIKAGIKVAESQ
jgi:hypothetical protein